MQDKSDGVEKSEVDFEKIFKEKVFSERYGCNRVMLKLSGEALAAGSGGYNDEAIKDISAQIMAAKNYVKNCTEKSLKVVGGIESEEESKRGRLDVGIVIGGGNYWRGRTSENIDRVKADQIGMLATIMNCIYVSEIFRSEGIATAVFSSFTCGTLTELFSKDRVNQCFEEGKVVFFAGGTGHPYFSTDTGVVLRAVEMEAGIILLAKAVDGIYDSDPKNNPDAVKYDVVSIQEVIDKKLAVLDLTASVMCMEHKIALAVFDLNKANSIAEAMRGEINGTIVTV